MVGVTDGVTTVGSMVGVGLMIMGVVVVAAGRGISVGVVVDVGVVMVVGVQAINRNTEDNTMNSLKMWDIEFFWEA